MNDHLASRALTCFYFIADISVHAFFMLFVLYDTLNILIIGSLRIRTHVVRCINTQIPKSEKMDNGLSFIMMIWVT